MKKIKLFALAVMAMLSSNAFAAIAGTDGTNEFTFNWQIDGDAKTAVITSFASGAEKAAVVIPVTVRGTQGEATGVDFTVVGIADDAFNNAAAKAVVASLSFATGSKVEEIGDAFSGCSLLKTVDFTNATELTAIDAGAFAGTIIETLDLSTTKLVNVPNLFGTVYGAGDANKPNATLNTVKLPATWEAIAGSAFENCTALATVSFGTIAAADLAGHAVQTIGTKAFLGCQVTALDFTGTKVTAIPAVLLTDDTYAKTNNSLKTVTLIGGITTLNASFANCTALSSINIEACKNADGEGVLVLTAGEFKNDEALTSIDLSYVDYIPESAFEGTGLTSLTFPKANATTHVEEVDYIGEYAFAYAPIKTITFADGFAAALDIDDYAFSLTQITDIKLPATTNSVAENAFNLVTTLKTVTFKPTVDPGADIFDNLAFNLCNDDAEANRIKVYTTYDYADNYGGAAAAKFTTYVGDPLETTVKVYNDEAKAFGKNWTVTSFGSKYYVKALAQDGIIKVKKSDAKVYAAYKDGDVLNMQMFKSVDQYYHIGIMYPALIITSKADLKFEDGAEVAGVTEANGSSFIAAADNAIKMNIDGAGDPVYTKFAQLFTAAAGKTIYGWTVNGTWNPCATSLASKAVPVGFLYMIGEQDAAGARIIRWIDEDGNVENEEVVTGIQNVMAVEAEDGDLYNLAGQKVNAAYKGVVIKNGKKMIQK